MILPWKLITLRETDLNGWCTGEPFFFGREQDFERERENQPIVACLSLSLSIFFFFFSSKIPFSYLFFHCFFFLILVFYFLVLKFLIPLCLSLLLLYTAKDSLYSVCRDRILLFWPSTTFVWSGYTYRPPLVRLCATPLRQTKENYFVHLSAVAPFSAMVWVPSLSLSLMACT